MNKEKKRGFWKYLLTGAVILSIGLSGCSKDEEVNAEATQTIIRVGTGATMPPYCFLDENGEPSGYDVEVVEAIGERYPEYKIEFEIMEFSALAVSLDTNKLDWATHQFVRTPERAAKFTIPEESYCRSLIKLIVRSDRDDLNTLEDMGGNNLLMDPASFEYQDVVKWNEEHGDNPIELTLASNVSVADSLRMVETKRVDAAITYATSFDSVQNELGLDVKRTGTVFTEEAIYLLAKGETELAANIDKALVEMRADGTLSAISVKWFGEDVFAE